MIGRCEMAEIGQRGVTITRTPLRISFGGGGTDLAEFYERDYGAVFSTSIASYIYVTVKRHSPLFNESIRINYSRSEEVNFIDEIENDIARECLRFMDIEPPIYISTVGDHPASTGLGGSSSFAVGLLHGLHAFRGERVSAGQLAEEASHIEIDVLGQPIGKQDQYAAAFGGLNLFTFKPSGAVSVEAHRSANGRVVSELFDWLMMFWTGHQRDAMSVLQEQRRNTPAKLESLTAMRGHAHRLYDMCGGDVDPIEFGSILDESWRLKRGLASTISTDQIDNWYAAAMAAGAIGGKICGAGGGGCMLFVVAPECRAAVRAALSDMVEVPLGYEARGSQVLIPFSG
jgi:D-glycero-alpha-D-manno-heptose-7-phosphate kinase